jgi:hypothetical protein
MRKQAAISFWQCAEQAARDDFRRSCWVTQDAALRRLPVLGFFRAEEGLRSRSVSCKHQQEERAVRDALGR